ncbi:3'-5' exonuclease [Sphingorhabdus lacus]|uniref:3'-5' exonuclease n=1 Tax=Sphingorhabdus lacus TaxID=392610 RepID=UPI00131C034E|nr:3'-5' exonuclease [Sphingorhabdus lacus]
MEKKHSAFGLITYDKGSKPMNNVQDHTACTRFPNRVLTDEHQEANAACRILHQVPDPFEIVPDAIPNGGRIIAICDVETTGLDIHHDQIIELAIMLVIVDAEGSIVGVMPPRSWLEDPGAPLDPRIIEITGITDADVARQQIDERQALAMFARASLVLAHNAKFDVGFIERRLPAAAGKDWACSCSEIDWPMLGFDTRVQGYLLMQSGWFNTAHRAAADVWSLYWLLQQQHGERTLLQRLLLASDQPTMRIDARYAPYRLKDDLKLRGYRWDSDSKVWWIEIAEGACETEVAWLYQLGVQSPLLTPITARERHRPLKVAATIMEEPDGPAF